MNSNFLVLIFQSLYIVPSSIVYLVIFFYICCSDEAEFSSSFYMLFLARAGADLVQVWTSIVSFRLPLSGWRAALQMPALAKIGFTLTQYSTLLAFGGQFLLSVNRLTAVAFPIAHRWIWQRSTTLCMFFVVAVVAVVPVAVRIPQQAAYIEFNDSIVPYLLDGQQQETNSLVSCCIYIACCASCSVLNAAAVYLHSSKVKSKMFDVQLRIADRVQTNLLIYSTAFTIAVAAMTACQCLLYLNVWPVESDAHSAVIIALTLSADIFALSNPWLLLLLSESFRSKFLGKGGLPKILFSASTTVVDA